jgi:hypothetical protein
VRGASFQRMNLYCQERRPLLKAKPQWIQLLLACSVYSCGGKVGSGAGSGTGGDAQMHENGGAAASGGQSAQAMGGESHEAGEVDSGSEFINVGGTGAQTSNDQTQLRAEETLLDYWKEEELLPADERPDAPEWAPPSFVDAVNFEPFCLPFEVAPDISGFYADKRGLFIAVARSCSEVLDVKGPCDPVEGSAIYQYSGSKWAVLGLPSYSVGRMVGVPDGPLFFGPSVVFDPAQGVDVVRNPFVHDTGWDNFEVVVAGSEVYLAAWHATGDSGSTQLAKFVDGEWSSSATANDTWELLGGDASGALYFNRQATVVAGEPPRFHELTSSPAYPALVAGLSTDDYWMVTDDSRIWHFEGETVTEVGLGLPPFSFFQMGEDRLYVLNSETFGYLSEQGLVSLATLDSSTEGHFEQLAVVEDNEVYLTIRDSSLDQYKCGGTIVLKFDGSTFERI